MATELRRAPRVVLHRAGEEGLREEEARDPEGGRRLDVVYPLLEEGQPAEHVGHVRAERLARRVGVLHPQRGAVAERERPGEGLELGVHDDETLDGLLEIGLRGYWGDYPCWGLELLFVTMDVAVGIEALWALPLTMHLLPVCSQCKCPVGWHDIQTLFGSADTLAHIIHFENSSRIRFQCRGGCFMDHPYAYFLGDDDVHFIARR